MVIFSCVSLTSRGGFYVLSSCQTGLGDEGVQITRKKDFSIFFIPFVQQKESRCAYVGRLSDTIR